MAVGEEERVEPIRQRWGLELCGEFFGLRSHSFVCVPGGCLWYVICNIMTGIWNEYHRLLTCCCVMEIIVSTMSENFLLKVVVFKYETNLIEVKMCRVAISVASYRSAWVNIVDVLVYSFSLC